MFSADQAERGDADMLEVSGSNGAVENDETAHDAEDCLLLGASRAGGPNKLHGPAIIRAGTGGDNFRDGFSAPPYGPGISDCASPDLETRAASPVSID